MAADKSRKIFYSMGEVAEMLDVSTTTIRFWESRFTILKPHRNKKGNRLFTATDLDNLKIIYHLVKERGMTLEGASKAIRDNRDDILRKAEIVERLLTVKSMLLEIKQELGLEDDQTLVDDEQVVIQPSVIEAASTEKAEKAEEAENKEEKAEDEQKEETIEKEEAQEEDNSISYEKEIIVQEQTLF